MYVGSFSFISLLLVEVYFSLLKGSIVTIFYSLRYLHMFRYYLVTQE